MKPIADLAKKHAETVKYVVSGGTAAVVNLGFLYIFTDIFKWWYIQSNVAAFLLAFCVSFTLQKFWTFRDHSREFMHRQLAFYLLSSLINLGINTLLLYILVDYFHLWYIFAQVLSSGLIALGSYFVYKHLIFKKAGSLTPQ